MKRSLDNITGAGPKTTVHCPMCNWGFQANHRGGVETLLAQVPKHQPALDGRDRYGLSAGELCLVSLLPWDVADSIVASVDALTGERRAALLLTLRQLNGG